MTYQKYLAVAKIKFIDTLEYKYDLLFQSIGTFCYIYAYVLLWQIIYTTYTFNDFTIAQLIWYFVLVQSLKGSSGFIVKSMVQFVQKGDIVNYLNKPMNFILYHYFELLGSFPIKTIILMFVSSLLAWYKFGFFKLEWYFIPLVIFIILLGITINFLISTILGLSAFWIEDAKPMHWIYEKFIFVLGGFLFPIEILPLFMQKIALWLPTAFYLYYPAKLTVNFSIEIFSYVVLMQIVYIIILVCIVSIVYVKGVKKVSINGG